MRTVRSGKATGTPALRFSSAMSIAVFHFFPTQTGIEPLVLGVEGTPWRRLALAVLGASLLGLAVLYSTSMRSGVAHLRDIEATRM